MLKRPAVAFFVLMLLTVFSGSALAGHVYQATLDGPQAGTASPGTGTAILVLNNAETELTYHIEYSGLLAAETVSHIHNAPIGIGGPPVKNLPLGSPKDGVWNATPDPIALTPAMVAELKAGNLYINIHSTLHPGGEIRGQILIGTPTLSPWGISLLLVVLLAAATFVILRRRARAAA